MTHFQYAAINRQGKPQKGTIYADNPKQARQLLRQKNLIPTALTVARNKKNIFQLSTWADLVTGRRHFFPSHAISKKTLSALTRQLAALVKAGLPITEILTAVSEQNTQPQTKNILSAIKTKVLAGHSLAQALHEHPDSFSPLYCGLITSGEKSGNLAKVLERLADYTEEQYKLKQKILHAMIYPMALIAVSLGIIIFLLDYVVPKMVSIYAHLNQTLPWLTQALISLSQGIKNFGLYFLLLLLSACWGFHAALKKKPRLREKCHRLMLRIPLLRQSIQTLNTARFARTLAMLSSSGVPVVEGMTTAAALSSNLPIRHALLTAVQQVREGSAIHLALKKTQLFPPLSIHLIASGEASGELETMLAHSAHQQEEEMTRLIDTLLTLFEPALILVMGGLVLTIVLAVLLPIFDLNQLNL